MPRLLPLVFALSMCSAHAATCESIREQVETRIKAAGVAQFTLATVDADAQAQGKVVGRCDLGSKKIMYIRGEGTSTANSAPPAPDGEKTHAISKQDREPILTECKDGRVLLGGNCK